MFGLGTIINVGAILLGGLFGVLFGKKLPERIRTTLIGAIGVAVMLLGIMGVISDMTKVNDGLTGSGALMLIVCLAVGSLIGELINIEGGVEKFGNYLKRKTKSEADNTFTDAFITASFTVCVGAMAIVGAIEDGISGDFSTLLAKSILDVVSIMILTATKGKGAIFSIIPVILLQGSLTVIFHFVGSYIPLAIINNISFVGNALIFCIGLNLIRDKKIRVANMLPSLIFAVIWALILPA